MSSRTASAAPPDPLTPQSQYERRFIRLARYVVEWCRWTEATEIRMWPPNADGASPGTPWGQPFWRIRLMEAFWSGQHEMKEQRKKQPK